MSRVYKTIRLVGVSSESFSAAVDDAISKAQETLDGLSWFEVIEQRGSIGDSGVSEYQAKVEVGFRLNE